MDKKNEQQEVKEENDTSINQESETQVELEDEVVNEECEESSEKTDEEKADDENVTDINSKLAEKKLKDEVDELNDKYQRLQAEYANYRRRTQQEKETIGVFANEKIITELIPVIDSMERALDACEDKEDTMYKGISLVHKQLIDTLVKFGVEEIEAESKEFDPNLHLAVMQESVDGVEANQIVMVLQKGYKLGTKVIRPSMVKVSC
ncbi:MULTISPECIES: nucleotide exchange factor GrpE [Clostridioides]|uniref:nucleotide exchange factor GrpE n=1 Tax=unclassified Clostridioides TaxID=2635829 RepID=UPI001D0C8457|nr:nucleotide exchange factor GrpE [Clostridioides sp. ZZV15-6388]MCC0635456.1 nucleotide exchange factor GrpE [Clostridioides sp. ES-S-0001-02]MCC0639183.1 nucleotide exchange factor GrpE [Clostridioides sp. ES-S-0049-03]MCC0642896.1 nucleotide exchange factor GrpE [Clostridioides sp. ZZV14-6150]MCC0647000.1 nucleotide exchange factor GrpE [Clostridioides sp. ZZV15-6598]MCC0652924.1 nucleotide exchange factor GrpE [Clostridioides sp. ES-S-0001-03]MCC0657092.1 nucleotide exchange factor GrpE 